jgi:hypothetical protein
MFTILSYLIVIFVTDVVASDEDFVRDTLHKVSYGNRDEITAWAYYAVDNFRIMKPHQNKPCIIGLVATANNNACILIRDISTGIVIHNINSVDDSYGIHEIDGLEFSPDSEQLAVACDSNVSNKDMRIIFFSTKSGKKLPQEVYLKSCSGVLAMNYSHDGKKFGILVENKIFDLSYEISHETSFQIYDISSKEPSRIKNEQTYMPFQISKLQSKDNCVIYYDKGKTEAELYSSMSQKKIYDRNAAFSTPYPSKDFSTVALEKAKQPNWSEKNLFNAITLISPDNHNVVTLYSNGVLHIWDAFTGNTSATFNCGIPYRRYFWDNGHGNCDYIQNLRFSRDGKFIIIETIKTIRIYNVYQNCLVATFKPPLEPTRPDLPDGLRCCDRIFESVLYDNKIIMITTFNSMFVYQINNPNKPIKKVNRDMYSFVFSPSCRYILFDNDTIKNDQHDNKQIECRYELWDNKIKKKIILPIGNYGSVYGSQFSHNEKFILFKKVEDNFPYKYREYYYASRKTNFYRYDISQNKFEVMNELDKIGAIVISDRSENGFFYARKPVIPNKDSEYAEDTYENERIVLNALSFDFVRREKFVTPQTNEKLDSNNEFFGYTNKLTNNIKENEWRFAMYIFDNNNKLKQVTLRFDIDDYLIIKADGKVTGTHKGIKRYIPNNL